MYWPNLNYYVVVKLGLERQKIIISRIHGAEMKFFRVAKGCTKEDLIRHGMELGIPESLRYKTEWRLHVERMDSTSTGKLHPALIADILHIAARYLSLIHI